ncbi:dynein light chain, putative [Hepatocystis sp. ex Piliocolobus tephrosceles]|nr:dynein light chain, putative [Hepatocystis sp. ex Piliocolobus tephrosceles]
METNHKILKYSSVFSMSKELKSYMLKVMENYKIHFDKALIKNCNLENNINLVKNFVIMEEKKKKKKKKKNNMPCSIINNYNEDIFLKMQKDFHIYDFFNLSLLFPIKILNTNEKKIVQLISEDTNINDLEHIQTILKNVEQSEVDNLKIFNIENIIFELSDEIIRQITIECSKRGYALILINNEIQKNIYYYKSLIEIIEHNNNINKENFKKSEEEYKIVLEQLSLEENELNDKLDELQHELQLLKNENAKKMQENKNKQEIQYDLLKHNESLLEKIQACYDKKGEF